MDFRPRPDPSWIDPIIDFANADIVDDDSAKAVVRSLYSSDFAYGDDVRGVYTREEVIAGPPDELRKHKRAIVIFNARFRDTGLDDLREHQHQLRSYLEQIIRGKALEKLLASLSGIGPLKGRAAFFIDEKIKTTVKISIYSIESWYAFGVATLIQDDFASRLGQCQLEECDNYFIDWTGKNPRAYCCDRHADRDRSRRRRKQTRERAARKRKRDRQRGLAEHSIDGGS